MKSGAKSLAYIAMLLLAASCNSTPDALKGLKKTETGAYMKFYEKSGSEVAPRIGDGVTFAMAQYFNDSLLFSTADSEPIEIVLEPAAFVGDISDALLVMHIGDSAQVAILADSVFASMGDMEVPEEYFGRYIYYDLKLLSIRPKEEIEAEYRRITDSLKTEEKLYLEQMRNSPNSERLASGLVVLDKSNKGKLAKLGDYVDFDFMMTDKDGDTLLSSFDYESVLMQYGEEFICKGVMEAMGMVPQGSTARFVIPSELGFDSTGYQGLILPYEPIVLKLKMNEVMDLVGYEKKMQAREAEKTKADLRRQAEEKEKIEAYVEKKGYGVKPTESGLYIVREKEGVGSVAEWGDAVAVHYTMRNLNDDQVESSYEVGKPMRFTIGQGEMIACIEEALMTMSPGAKVTLVSPSELGFGEFAVHQELLPSYSPLVIELELVAIE